MKATKTVNKTIKTSLKEKIELMQLMEWKLWKKDPTAFINDCCYTVNEAKSGAVEHFPRLDYLARVDEIIHHEQVAAFPKSRRMMMTWRCLANLLHYAMFGKNLSIFVQSKKYDDSAYLLGDSRLMFLYEHLPKTHEWPAVERKTRSKMGYDYIKFSNGVELRAVAEGADQLRQYTASVVYCTEMAFWDFAQATWNSLRPTIEGGGRIFIDSSANPGFFCQLVTGQLNEGEPDEEQEPHDVLEGVHEYRRNGVYIARIHYTADPNKRSEEWKEHEKKGTTTEGWEREYEINWTVSAEPKYYPEFDYQRHVALEELADRSSCRSTMDLPLQRSLHRQRQKGNCSYYRNCSPGIAGCWPMAGRYSQSYRRFTVDTAIVQSVTLPGTSAHRATKRPQTKSSVTGTASP